jgi:hypothetical protein
MTSRFKLATFRFVIVKVPNFILSVIRKTYMSGLLKNNLKLKLIYDRQSVGQSVLVSGAHLGPVTNFSFAMKFPLDSCGFGIL